MNRTKIEYLTHTWNPIKMKCTPVSEGCLNCWHLVQCNIRRNNSKLPDRLRDVYAGIRRPYLDKKELRAPLKLKKPSIIGVQFMGDIFHEKISNYHVGWYGKIFKIIQ